MFAVLETVTVPVRRFWNGRSHSVTLQDKPGCVRIRLDIPLRAREGRLRKMAHRAIRAAARNGSEGIVLPTDFPFPELARECGLAVSSSVPVLRRLAVPLCRMAVDEAGFSWKNSRLQLLGSRSTPEMLSAAQALASSVRTLYLDAGRDSDAACYLLRSRCGISAVGRPPGNSFGEADVILLFDGSFREPLRIGERAVILNLTGERLVLPGGRLIDGAVLEPPRSMWKNWPVGCDTGAMLAALLASGQISLGEIGIRGLRYSS